MAMTNLQIEKFAGLENYSTWKFAVKSYLEHEDLWECVDPGINADSKKDIKAKSKIILLVEPINYVHIENAKSSQEVWTNLQNAYEDSGLSRKVGLLKDLINTSLDSCSSVEDYVNKIMGTAYKLRNIGFEVGDEWLGTLMLAGLPNNYKPMVMGLESSGIKISSDFIKTKLLQEVKVSESSASSACVQEATWLKQFQESFWEQLRLEPMIIFSDNQSSIKLSGTDGLHSRTKHIDVRHHFVRDKVIAKVIDVQYVQTDMMVADALTKATSLAKLAYCSSKMGLCLREDVEGGLNII